MAVLYKLESFEGPLDLLLHLIDKAEVDIYNIPISEITDQYMEYIGSFDHMELGPTSEFLVMAATLLAIKSSMLLPKPPPEIEIEGYEDGVDAREELIQKLIEYRKFKGIAEHLRDRELERSLIYSREPGDLTPFMPENKENPLKGLDMSDLILAFQRVMKRSIRRDTVATIRRDEISVKDRINEVIHILKASKGKQVLFTSLFTRHSKEEIVATFLALLELMKVKRAACFQHSLFDDIVIQYIDEGENNEHGLFVDEIDY